MMLLMDKHITSDITEEVLYILDWVHQRDYTV